jgi:hypothetical protein
VLGVARDQEGVGAGRAQDRDELLGHSDGRPFGGSPGSGARAPEPEVQVGDHERAGTSPLPRLEEEGRGARDRDEVRLHAGPDPLGSQEGSCRSYAANRGLRGMLGVLRSSGPRSSAAASRDTNVLIYIRVVNRF